MKIGSLIVFSLIGFIIWTATFVPRRGTHKAALSQICELVGEKFFRNDAQLEAWRVDCVEQSHNVGFWWTRDRFMQEVQYVMDGMEVSHLMVYNPVEDRRLWKGEAVDTGLRLRLIDGRLVVYEIIKKSPAEIADIRVGDELLTINDIPTKSAWSAQDNKGHFVFQRTGKNFELDLVPKPLIIDHAPSLSEISPGVGWLEISSFRAEYFKEDEWRVIVKELPKYKKLIVDLRDNSGGNLVAMLRALSPFFCKETKVGSLSQPRRKEALGPAPADNLDEMVQLAWLEKFREVPLNTFTSYGCVTAPVVVLMDGGTASVSEIFAQAMLVRPLTKVWGRPSAGDVLLATWYGLPLLGNGYSLSIPEALYLTMSGDSLEGGGVWPQQELSYIISEALAGKDSWLLRAQGL